MQWAQVINNTRLLEYLVMRIPHPHIGCIIYICTSWFYSLQKVSPQVIQCIALPIIADFVAISINRCKNSEMLYIHLFKRAFTKQQFLHVFIRDCSGGKPWRLCSVEVCIGILVSLSVLLHKELSTHRLFILIPHKTFHASVPSISHSCVSPQHFKFAHIMKFKFVCQPDVFLFPFAAPFTKPCFVNTVYL